MNPTYTYKEALALMISLDLEGLELMNDLISEESLGYSAIEYEKITTALEYLMRDEKKKKGF